MKLAIGSLVLVLSAAAAATTAARAQDGKWKPYAFKGNERYDYKIVQLDGETKKETGFGLDLRTKGEDFEVTWSTRSTMKKSESDQIMMAGWAQSAPAMTIMNPMYAMFINDLELKEGEKLSFMGMGMVKVTGKETLGGRTGFVCKLFQKQDDKEVLTWEWTVDPELALPIKSILLENGQEKARVELTAYKKD